MLFIKIACVLLSLHAIYKYNMKAILLQYFFSPPPPLGLLFLLSLIFLRQTTGSPHNLFV